MSGTDYKFNTRIEPDGGNGANAVTVLETFELYGCLLKVQLQQFSIFNT